jgi:hypothetical protein
MMNHAGEFLETPGGRKDACCLFYTHTRSWEQRCITEHVFAVVRNTIMQHDGDSTP